MRTMILSRRRAPQSPGKAVRNVVWGGAGSVSPGRRRESEPRVCLVHGRRSSGSTTCGVADVRGSGARDARASRPGCGGGGGRARSVMRLRCRASSANGPPRCWPVTRWTSTAGPVGEQHAGRTELPHRRVPCLRAAVSLRGRLLRRSEPVTGPVAVVRHDDRLLEPLRPSRRSQRPRDTALARRTRRAGLRPAARPRCVRHPSGGSVPGASMPLLAVPGGRIMSLWWSGALYRAGGMPRPIYRASACWRATPPRRLPPRRC